MAQPSVMESNGADGLDTREASQPPPVAPGKRKRDTSDEGDEDVKPMIIDDVKPLVRDQKELVKSCFEVLSRYVT